MTPPDVSMRPIVEDPWVALLRLDDEIAASRIALATMHLIDDDSDPLALSAQGILLALGDLGDVVERYMRACGYRDVLIGGLRAA